MEYHLILLSPSAYAEWQSAGLFPDLAAKIPHSSEAKFILTLNQSDFLEEYNLSSDPVPAKPLSFAWVCALEVELKKYGFNTHRLKLKSIVVDPELGVIVSYRDR